MKQEKNKNHGIYITDIEFLENADNVYRTRDYIVKQVIAILVSDEDFPILHSDDKYYLRNSQRDIRYEYVFRGRQDINGMRIKTSSHTRKYID